MATIAKNPATITAVPIQNMEIPERFGNCQFQRKIIQPNVHRLHPERAGFAFSGCKSVNTVQLRSLKAELQQPELQLFQRQTI